MLGIWNLTVLNVLLITQVAHLHCFSCAANGDESLTCPFRDSKLSTFAVLRNILEGKLVGYTWNMSVITSIKMRWKEFLDICIQYSKSLLVLFKKMDQDESYGVSWGMADDADEHPDMDQVSSFLFLYLWSAKHKQSQS